MRSLGGGRRGIALIGVLLLALVFAVSPAEAAKSKLQRSLDRIVGMTGGPPGISVWVKRNALNEWFATGAADVRSGRAPRSFDRMRIASVSKAFNAYVALALVRRGKLRLGDRIGERLPGMFPEAEDVTLRQLLQHTSGLADYIRDPTFLEGLAARPGAYLSPQQLIDFVRLDPLEFAPGSRYHYSDTDNIVAALIAEAASGRSYERLLDQFPFGIVGVAESTLPRTTQMPEPYLHGYDIEAGKRPDDVSELINPAGAWASGGIVSTPRDLIAFGGAYIPAVLAASRRIPGPFRPGASSPPGPGRNSAGLGIFRYRTGCGTVYGHTGSFPGYRMLLAGSANGRRLVAFSVNAQIIPGQGSPRVARAILRAQRLALCRALR